MEAALRQMLQSTFGEYVDGLDRAEAASFPLTLKDLKLREKKIQEELDEDGGFPFDITDGRIGSVSISPSMWGTVEVTASNIVLNFAFSPMKAMNKALRGDKDDDDGEEEQMQGLPGQYAMPAHPGVPMQQRGPPPAPAAPVPPRYCSKHNTSEQRVKVEPRMVECASCHTKVQTNYQDFTLCPGCSEREQRCMLCGCSAPNAGNYVPANQVNAAPPAPVFAVAPTAERGSFGGGPSRMASSARGPAPSNGPSRFSSSGVAPSSQSSFPPPPPPMHPPRTPSNVNADWDWLPGGSSSTDQGAPPAPPPPPQGRRPQGNSRPGPGGGPRSPPRQQVPPGGASPSMQGTRQVPPQAGGSLLSNVTALQDKSASEHMDSLMGYIRNLQMPMIDIGNWASCINGNDMRSGFDEVHPGGPQRSMAGMPPPQAGQPWRGGA